MVKLLITPPHLYNHRGEWCPTWNRNVVMEKVISPEKKTAFPRKWQYPGTDPNSYQLFTIAALSSVHFSSAAQSCLTLCDPMNCSMPGLPVHYQLPDFTQTPVHQVGDAIQPSHPLSSPSPAPTPPSIRVFSNESALRRSVLFGPK